MEAYVESNSSIFSGVKKLLIPMLLTLPVVRSASMVAHVAEIGMSFLIIFPFSSLG